MTFESAINGLTNGKAAKLTSWGGYVAKSINSAVTVPEWSETAGYSKNNIVTNSGDYYIAKEDIAAPSAGSVNVFDSSKWAACDAPFKLTFQERSDTADVDHDANASYVFTATPKVADDGVKYVFTEPSGAPLSIDGELLAALLSSDWTTGSTDDFEAARTGSAGRW